MSDELDIGCRVEWKQLWRSLSIAGIATVWIGTTPIILLHWWKQGKEKASEHMSPVKFLLVLGALSLVLIIFALSIALLMRCGAIQIK